MIDAAMEAGEPSYIKILVTNLVTCKREYDVTITSSGEVFFTDVDKRQIGEVVEGREVKYVVGSARDETCDGCQESASFVQPTGLCLEGDLLYVTDIGAGALNLIDNTYQTNS